VSFINTYALRASNSRQAGKHSGNLLRSKSLQYNKQTSAQKWKREERLLFISQTIYRKYDNNKLLDEYQKKFKFLIM
jgi:hypothetical protein